MFSVVIPMYQSEKTIERAIRSVWRQTAYDFIDEILVIDDGSKDQSASIVEKLSRGKDSKIKLIQTKNYGPATARNAGLKEAKADYVAFLDADDVWMPDKMEQQKNAIEKIGSVELLSSGFDEKPLNILWKHYSELTKVSIKDYCIKSFIFTSTVIIKRDCIDKYGLFDENMKYSEDMNYYQRFFQGNQVYYLPIWATEYAPDREYYGASGLSSNLREMHLGRRKNFKDLLEQHQIGIPFYIMMVLFGELKYVRRKLLTKKKK
ncbi:MAG: glycosyltransferase family 2 protein [Lachnospiraceae bacterium]|nr:glycosyltransferase family 2 protein [Lachnospiraceae bacterium]